MILKSTRYLFVIILLVLMHAISFAQPSNDDCSTATPITLGFGTCGSTIAADNTNATGIAGNVCGQASTFFGDGDIWYSFEAGGTVAYLDLISEPGGAPGEATAASMYISVYDACGGTCIYNNNAIATTAVEVITGLTPGSTYFIRMYELGNNNFGAFEFCMFDPGAAPVNDECVGATSVTLGIGSCGPTVAATNAFATGVAGDVCGSTSTAYGDGDIWFSFTAGGNEAFLDLLSEPGGGTAASMFISVYDDCDGNCVYNNNAIVTTSVETITGLTPGNTYLIRMYELSNNNTGAFEFCMFDPSPPPANDECAGAISVTLGTGSCGPTVTATNAFATGVAGDVCGSTSTLYGDGDIWFSFVAGSTSAYLDLLSEPGGGTLADVFISVYDDCGGNCVYDNSNIITTTSEIITGLTPGSTYLIRMYESGNNVSGSFEFCMFNPGPPPANDECSGATVVTLGTGVCGPTVTATNVFATGTSGDVCGSSSTLYGDSDIWFSFEAGGTEAFLDLLSEPGPGTAASMYISVYDACGGSCVYNNNAIVTTSVETITGLTPGNTYLIRMYESGNNAFGTFEFCMFDPGLPPVNDECTGAISVSLGIGVCGPSVTADNTFATGVAGDVCGSTSISFGDGDLWFSFVAEAETVYLDMSIENGSQWLSIYDACGGSCVYNNNSLTTSTEEIISGLTPGSSYLIRLYELSNNTFGISEFCMYYIPENPAVAPASGCAGTVSAMVDGSGSPAVVDFIDSSGDIYASIENTQNLGSVSVSLYGDAGPRQNSSGDYYLDRNVAIVPTLQPSAAVDVTIYALNTEVNALTAVSPNANSVSDFQFAKVSGTSTCTAVFPGVADFVTLTPAAYGSDWAFTGSVTSFSEFFVFPIGSILPVELSSFNAYATETNNRIEWKAASEVNLFMYYVERGVDSKNFSAFAEVTPKVAGNRELTYTSEDLSPAATTYYRLRIEDLDGAVDYSDIVVVNRDDKDLSLRMFPNPTNGKITFDLSGHTLSDDNLAVILSDLNGNIVRELSLVPGERTVISVADIPSGMYVVSFVSGHGIQNQRLIID